MHILVTVETKPHHRALLEAAAPQAAFVYKESGVARADVEKADILLGNVSPALLSPKDKLQWMQTASAGVDGYIHGCLPQGAVLTNATGAYGLAISEYMVAVWLMLLKKLHSPPARGGTSARSRRRGIPRCSCSASATSAASSQSAPRRSAPA